MGAPDDSSLKAPTLSSTLLALDLGLKTRVRRTRLALKDVQHSLREGSFDLALRQIDRAWRCHPGDCELLAPIYGRLLSLEGHDHAAALRLLERVVAPDADTEALAVDALLRLHRRREAVQRLECALEDFCVVPGGLLERVASRVLADRAVEARGWIGLGSSLEFTGELKDSGPATSLRIQLESGTEFTQLVHSSANDGRRAFRFKLAHEIHGATLRIGDRDMPLLGGARRMPPTFGLDGRATADGNTLSGWARVRWSPSQRIQLYLEDEGGERRWIPTRSEAGPGFCWPFRIPLRRAGLRGDRIHVSAQMPDGSLQPLPDSPVLLREAVQLPGNRTQLPGRWRAGPSRQRTAASASRSNRSIDVIIPVYRGVQESLSCIEAALATRIPHAHVVVVDDASVEPALPAALDQLAAAGRITLLRNEANLGFVASVNRALALHPERDAVLLNSDAMVFGDWLERLRAAAYSGSRVGSVTPLSNNGSIASYPGPTTQQDLGVTEAAALHALAATTNPGITVEIPVGVGFCLFLRRDCLREVGLFDAAVFGKGYGEETDFCLRARQRGWSHRLAADVFVYHAGGQSFGDRRAALLDRSQRLINLRHPGYDRHIASFSKIDPLKLPRRRLDERRLSSVEGRFVLSVTLALTGGVERFVTDRGREIRARGLIPLVLRPAAVANARRCLLSTDIIDVPNLLYEIPDEIDALTDLLRALPIEAVEIQHFLHLDARLIDAVRALGRPYDVFVHDYAWICPRVTLIGGQGRYCGEPAVSACNSCIRRNGSNLGEDLTVTALRARSATWLSGARQVIVPSNDTAARLRRYFPGRDFQVSPNSQPIIPNSTQSPPSPTAVVRVAVIGAIGEHKGYSVLLKCARDAKARRLPIEFIVVGYTENDAALLATGKVFITGRYSEGEASHLLRRERPHITFLPSVWPETWSYTLDEALGIGSPVVAFDLGAIAERLRAADRGILLPPDCEPRRINERIMQSIREGALSNERQVAIIDASRESPIMPSNTDSLLQEGLSASVQILPLPAGLYLFSVKAANPSTHQAIGQLQLPAMHVGLGPGVRSGQVEFVAGPGTEGAWLFAQDDLLVTKIRGDGATLMLTSVRAPGGEVLSIKVERLESRADSGDATAAIAARPKESSAQPGAPSAVTDSATASTTRDGALSLQIVAHIRARGDMSFTDAAWAGRVAPGLWIESFAVRPLDGFEPKDIELKGLTGSGFETPWISDGQMCGTKGMSTPLVGFAVRLKPGPHTAGYDCEYSGYFKSGEIVGPMRNGAPCRSTVANDALEGIQVRVCKRSLSGKATATLDKMSPPQPSSALQPLASKGKAKPLVRAALASTRKQNGAVPSKQRSPARRS